MSTKQGLNTRSSATKRILQEHREFLADPSPDFVAHPLEEDIFEWHVTVRGVENSEYAGGIYHLRIVLKNQYPMQAPDILVTTPQGRFEPNRKICIDGLTSFHEGSWRPAWGVRTAIVGLMSFWSQSGEALAGVGAMNCDKDERKRLAKLSVDWTCPVCQKSNKEIMQEHEEVLNVKEVKKYKESQTDEKGQTSPVTVQSHPISRPQVTSTTTHIDKSSQHEGEKQLGERVPDSSGMHSPEAAATLSESLGSHNPSSIMPRPTARPATIMLTDYPAESPAPSIFMRALLTPPPSYLAPLRIAHYHLCKLFCPVQHRQYLPARPDSILWLDTLIFFILSALAIIMLGKLARSWSRIVYVIFRAFEKASGIDMSWITDKFSPTRLPDNPYAQYWASGGAAAAAGLHGDRTRLRNMDTAMRAREIARRFGRPAHAEGAHMRAPTRGERPVEPGAGGPAAGNGPGQHAVDL